MYTYTYIMTVSNYKTRFESMKVRFYSNSTQLYSKNHTLLKND